MDDIISVNQAKCIRCAACIKECPMSVIEMQEGSYPQSTKDAQTECIACGHCMAVCPTNAIALKNINCDGLKSFSTDLKISPEQLENLIKGRRSIRHFENKNVDKKIIERLIDIARYAPSAKNLQPLEWVVVYEKEQMKKLVDLAAKWMRQTIKEDKDFADKQGFRRVVVAWRRGFDQIFRGAPHAVIVHAQKDNMAAMSSGYIALTCFELAAASFNLGACWAGYFNRAALFSKELQEALNIPEGNVCCGAMMLGITGIKYYRIPPRKIPKIHWM